MRNVWSSVIGSLSLAMAIALGGCGGAADASAPAKAPDSPVAAPAERPREEVAEPRTVEEAQDQIARARAALEPPAKVGSEAKPADPGAPKTAPSDSASRSETVRDQCGGPCRALDSMRHAVEALCRMTGDGDSRCVDARKTFSGSVTRLSSCKCDVR